MMSWHSHSLWVVRPVNSLYLPCPKTARSHWVCIVNATGILEAILCSVKGTRLAQDWVITSDHIVEVLTCYDTCGHCVRGPVKGRMVNYYSLHLGTAQSMKLFKSYCRCKTGTHRGYYQCVKGAAKSSCCQLSSWRCLSNGLGPLL